MTSVILAGAMIAGIAGQGISLADNAKDSKISVERIGGENRYETALKVANYLKTTKSLKEIEAFVVNGKNFPDALAVGPVAAANNKAIVLTDGRTDLNSRLKSMGVNKATIVGGVNSVSSEIEKNLSKDMLVDRIAGANRYDTAKMVVEKAGIKTVGVATGRDFPDALVSGALLGAKGQGLILVDGRKSESIPQGLSASYTFGGTNSVKDTYGKRLAGKGRYDTSVEVAKELGTSDTVVLASGKVFADALTAAPMAKAMNSPIILTNGNDLTKEGQDLIKKAKKVVIVGGESTITKALAKKVANKFETNTEESKKPEPKKPYTSNKTNGSKTPEKPKKPDEKKKTLESVKIVAQDKAKIGDTIDVKTELGKKTNLEDKDVSVDIVMTKTSEDTLLKEGKLTVGLDEIGPVKIVATAKYKDENKADKEIRAEKSIEIDNAVMLSIIPMGINGENLEKASDKKLAGRDILTSSGKKVNDIEGIKEVLSQYEAEHDSYTFKEWQLDKGQKIEKAALLEKMIDKNTLVKGEDKYSMVIRPVYEKKVPITHSKPILDKLTLDNACGIAISSNNDDSTGWFKEFSSGKATIVYNGQVISKKLDKKIFMPRSDQELSYAYEDGGLKRIFIYGLKLDDTVKISIPSYPDVTLKAVKGNPFDPYTLREAK